MPRCRHHRSAGASTATAKAIERPIGSSQVALQHGRAVVTNRYGRNSVCKQPSWTSRWSSLGDLDNHDELQRLLSEDPVQQFFLPDDRVQSRTSEGLLLKLRDLGARAEHLASIATR